jgi:hypothetical protein
VRPILSEVTKGFLPYHNEIFVVEPLVDWVGCMGNWYVVHFADPHYLLTPEQCGSNVANGKMTTAEGASPFKTTTRPVYAAHATVNYL